MQHLEIWVQRVTWLRREEPFILKWYQLPCFSTYMTRLVESASGTDSWLLDVYDICVSYPENLYFWFTKRDFFCSAFAIENNKSIPRIDAGLVSAMPLRCNTNGILTKIRSVDLGLLREVFLIFSCSAPWTSSGWGHTGIRDNADEVTGQPGQGMILAVLVRSASVGREFSSSDKTRGNVYGLTSYKYVEATAPGKKIVKRGGLEDFRFSSLKAPFSEFLPLLGGVFPTWVYNVDAKFK